MHTQQAISAFDAAVSEVGVRNVLLADRLRGAFVRHIAAAPQPPAAQQGEAVAISSGMCQRCGKWAGAHATLPGQPTDHLCRCQPAAAPQPQKPLDDPRLQELFGSAISGALALGAAEESPPPAGHWLAAWWQRGRDGAAAPQPVAQGVTMTDALIDRFESSRIERHLTINPGTDIEHRAHDRARDEYDAARAALAAAPAGVVGEAVAPAGRLHADGYFTWARREGYVMDRRLPCDFYLAAPPARQALTDEQIDALPWWPHEGDPMTFAEGLRDFARAIERAHGIGGKGETA